MIRRVAAARLFGRHPSASGPGFVMIEVLVSMTIFAVGIMAVLSAVLTALNLQKDSALRYRAGLILQEKLAETSVVPYTGMPMRGLSADGVFSWTIAGEPWVGAPVVVDREAETNPTPNQPEPVEHLIGLYEVAVEVSWLTSRGARGIDATRLVRIASPPAETP